MIKTYLDSGVLIAVARGIDTISLKAIATNIKETIIYYPWAFSTHQKVEFIDTPGLNDDKAMTERTIAILQQCDVAIMMISAQSPFAFKEFIPTFINVETDDRFSSWMRFN